MHHDIRVENDGGEVMPFAFGYHPAFLCPFDAAHKAEDYVLRFDTPQTPTVIETGEDDGLVTARPVFILKVRQTFRCMTACSTTTATCFSRLSGLGAFPIVEKRRAAA